MCVCVSVWVGRTFDIVLSGTRAVGFCPIIYLLRVNGRRWLRILFSGSETQSRMASTIKVYDMLGPPSMGHMLAYCSCVARVYVVFLRKDLFSRQQAADFKKLVQDSIVFPPCHVSASSKTCARYCIDISVLRGRCTASISLSRVHVRACYVRSALQT